MRRLTVKEAAELVGVSGPTITRLCRRNERSSLVERKGRVFLIDVRLLKMHYPDAPFDEIEESPSPGNQAKEEQEEIVPEQSNKELLDKITAFQEEVSKEMRALKNFTGERFAGIHGALGAVNRRIAQLQESIHGIEYSKAVEEVQSIKAEFSNLAARNEEWFSYFLYREKSHSKTLNAMAFPPKKEEEPEPMPAVVVVEKKPFRWEWLNKNISFAPLLFIAFVLWLSMVFQEPVRVHFGLVTEQGGTPTPLVYFVPAALYAGYSYLSGRLNLARSN